MQTVYQANDADFHFIFRELLCTYEGVLGYKTVIAISKINKQFCKTALDVYFSYLPLHTLLKIENCIKKLRETSDLKNLLTNWLEKIPQRKEHLLETRRALLSCLYKDTPENPSDDKFYNTEHSILDWACSSIQNDCLAICEKISGLNKQDEFSEESEDTCTAQQELWDNILVPIENYYMLEELPINVEGMTTLGILIGRIELTNDGAEISIDEISDDTSSNEPESSEIDPMDNE